MQPLDEAIQDLDWAVGLRRVGTRKTMIGAIITAGLLVTSLVIGLASLVETSVEIPDQWNVVVGGLLVVLTVPMGFTLYRSYRGNTMSRQEWIDERIEELRKQLSR